MAGTGEGHMGWCCFWHLGLHLQPPCRREEPSAHFFSAAVAGSSLSLSIMQAMLLFTCQSLSVTNQKHHAVILFYFYFHFFSLTIQDQKGNLRFSFFLFMFLKEKKWVKSFRFKMKIKTSFCNSWRKSLDLQSKKHSYILCIVKS